MKLIKKYSVLVAVFATTLFASCLKDNETKYTGDFVEMDAAVYTANSAGVTFPIITRVPGYGQPIISAPIAASGTFPAIPADPLISRTSGTIRFRVNLVGPQRSTPTVVNYTATGFGTNQATAGTHFTTGNTVEIPANSSYGEIVVQIINPGVTSATARDFVITLTGASDLPPSENEKSVGIRISQL